MMEVVSKIIQWHYDRNLIEGATDDGQFKKLMSEFGEYSDNLAKGRCTKDDIGDMGVVLLNIAERNGCVDKVLKSSLSISSTSYGSLLASLQDLCYYIDNENKDFYELSVKACLVDLWENLIATASDNDYSLRGCLEVAYEDIKDRKGQMINGTFVKESDLV